MGSIVRATVLVVVLVGVARFFAAFIDAPVSTGSSAE